MKPKMTLEEFSRRGGLARAKKLTAKRRSEIARKAGQGNRKKDGAK
jgi:hypothetical protein